MAKKSMIEREKKRERLVKKYAAKREALKEIVNDQSKPMEERFRASMKLAELPRNSSPTRLHNRCQRSWMIFPKDSLSGFYDFLVEVDVDIGQDFRDIDRRNEIRRFVGERCHSNAIAYFEGGTGTFSDDTQHPIYVTNPDSVCTWRRF